MDGTQRLNPGVDVDTVYEGQDILVPVKPPVVGQGARRRAADSWHSGPTEIPVSECAATQQATDATDVFMASRLTTQRTDVRQQTRSGVVMVPPPLPPAPSSSHSLAGLRGGALLLIPAAALAVGVMGWGLAGRWLGVGRARNGAAGPTRNNAAASAVASAAASAASAAKGEVLWEQWLRRSESRREPESAAAVPQPAAARARAASASYAAVEANTSPVEEARLRPRAGDVSLNPKPMRRRILDDAAAEAVAEVTTARNPKPTCCCCWGAPHGGEGGD
jgi:hypothetical protein